MCCSSSVYRGGLEKRRRRIVLSSSPSSSKIGAPQVAGLADAEARARASTNFQMTGRMRSHLHDPSTRASIARHDRRQFPLRPPSSSCSSSPKSPRSVHVQTPNGNPVNHGIGAHRPHHRCLPSRDSLRLPPVDSVSRILSQRAEAVAHPVSIFGPGYKAVKADGDTDSSPLSHRCATVKTCKFVGLRGRVARCILSYHYHPAHLASWVMYRECIEESRGHSASSVSAVGISSYFCAHSSSPHVDHAANMYNFACNLMAVVPEPSGVCLGLDL